MKNINNGNGDSFQNYLKIVSSIKKLDIKGRLMQEEKSVEQDYLNYTYNYRINKLENLKPRVMCEQESSDLLFLYEPRRPVLSEIKPRCSLGGTDIPLVHCPYCTFGEIGALDHYLPKTVFPEYAVNTDNLIPICSICNQKKTDSWLQDGERLFINAYIDLIPEIQYLFVQLDTDDTATFYTQKNQCITDKQYALIESHYTRLELLKRFRYNSSSVISEFKRTISMITNDESWSTLKENLEDDKKIYGYNEWKTVLKFEIFKKYNPLRNPK